MKRVMVIGLGTFGSQLARQLYASGLEVVAIDKRKDVVQRIRDHSTKAVVADATDREMLESIGIQPGDTVVISFGEDLSASTLLTLYLKELKVAEIIVKVPNEDYQRILLKVGASEAIIPEREVANKLARKVLVSVPGKSPPVVGSSLSETAWPLALPMFLGRQNPGRPVMLSGSKPDFGQ